ncbi:MAG: PEP-CTERM sorting domain-containing protein [Alphaproteobacteria bacterium]|nr:PEP-CTERM sorting domain-containing protein [Alphaproteobacteria bacterium]MCB9930005.1 PEP-CTERM sorting domain-containing protein [Alphaproteobacteria bacterium]
MALVAVAAIGASAPSQATLLLDTDRTVISGATGTLNPAGVTPALTTPATGDTGFEISFTLNSSGTNTITFKAINDELLRVTGGGQAGIAADDGLTSGLSFLLSEGVRRLELNPDVNNDGNYRITLNTSTNDTYIWEVALKGNGQNRALAFSDPLDSLVIVGGSIESLDPQASELVDLIQPRFGGVCNQNCAGANSQVSEPGTLAALSLGVVGLGLIRRRKAA